MIVQMNLYLKKMNSINLGKTDRVEIVRESLTSTYFVDLLTNIVANSAAGRDLFD